MLLIVNDNDKKSEDVKLETLYVDIESMKKLALIMILSVTSVVLSAEEYTIQVINAQKEQSITPAFMKKVQKSGLSIQKKKEADRYIVTVGKFKTKEGAKSALKNVKEVVICDAFIRPVVRGNTAVAKAQSSKKEVAQAIAKAEDPKNGGHAAAKTSEVKTAAAPAAAKPVIQAKTEPAAQAVHMVSTESHPMTIAVEVAEPGATPGSAVSPDLSKKVGAAAAVNNTGPSSITLAMAEKKAAQKSAISEAIEYYRTSPYHRFEPVGLSR